MTTCSKTFTDIPFGHRQHQHDGHCAFVHGHNWSVTVTFECSEFDGNGFVIDFGKLGFLKAWIEENLDHAMVFSADDPLREELLAVGGAWKPYVVENCSCEGIARHLFETFDGLVRAETGGRVHVTLIEVAEDSRNRASYTPG